MRCSAAASSGLAPLTAELTIEESQYEYELLYMNYSEQRKYGNDPFHWAPYYHETIYQFLNFITINKEAQMLLKKLMPLNLVSFFLDTVTTCTQRYLKGVRLPHTESNNILEHVCHVTNLYSKGL